MKKPKSNRIDSQNKANGWLLQHRPGTTLVHYGNYGGTTHSAIIHNYHGVKTYTHFDSFEAAKAAVERMRCHHAVAEAYGYAESRRVKRFSNLQGDPILEEKYLAELRLQGAKRQKAIEIFPEMYTFLKDYALCQNKDGSVRVQCLSYGDKSDTLVRPFLKEKWWGKHKYEPVIPAAEVVPVFNRIKKLAVFS